MVPFEFPNHLGFVVVSLFVREIPADKHSGFSTGAHRWCSWGMRCRARTPHLARAPCARGGSICLFSTHPGVAWLHSRPVCLVRGVCRHAPVLCVFRACLTTPRCRHCRVLIQDFDMVVCYDYVGCIHMLKSSRLNEMWWRYWCWRVAGV
jgi:hypothetical protein